MQRRIQHMGLLVAIWIVGLLLPGGAVAAVLAVPAQQPSPPEPAQDWSRIQAAGKILFGTSADYPPFEFYNSNFELDGFDVALAKAIGKQLGVEVVFNDFAFDGLLGALQLGQVDAAISALSVTPARQQIVDFSSLYYVGNSVAIAHSSFTGEINSPTDLSGLRVGVQRGSTYQSWAQENLVEKGVIAQQDLVPYSTASEVVRDVGNRIIDVALMGEATAELAVKRNSELQVAGTSFNQQQYAIAVPKGSSLAAPLNQALIALQSDGTFADLVRQYLQTNANHVIPDPEPTATPVPAAATPVPAPCVTSMAFVADLNLDDRNMTAPPIMVPGQDFSKGWRILNNGTCDWGADVALVYVRGNRVEAGMGGTAVPVGRPLKAGETVDLTVNLRAPQVYGVFQGFWQMRDALGQYFGEVVWVGIQVPDPAPPPPPPPPATSANPNLRVDSNYINAGQCTTVRWDVDNVRAVYFVEGSNVQGVGGHDARNVCPGGTTTYTLRVVDIAGGERDYPITVNVSGAAGYTMNFSADNTNLSGGQCTTLRWDVRNVQAVYLDGEGVNGVSAREVCPGKTRTYRLTAIKMDGGQDERQVTLNVNSPPPPPQPQNPSIRRFTVDNNQVFQGNCINFEWRTDNVQGVNLLRNGGAVVAGGPGNGQAQDCPDAAGLYEYKLVAYGVGQTEQALTVNVMGPTPR